MDGVPIVEEYIQLVDRNACDVQKFDCSVIDAVSIIEECIQLVDRNACDVHHALCMCASRTPTDAMTDAIDRLREELQLIKTSFVANIERWREVEEEQYL
jgi:hypothetical protein